MPVTWALWHSLSNILFFLKAESHSCPYGAAFYCSFHFRGHSRVLTIFANTWIFVPILKSMYYTKNTSFFPFKTRKSCFSYRTGFHCSTVLLFLWNCFYCTAVSMKFLQFLWSFYCFNNVPPVLLFLQSFYCFFETSTVSKMFLHPFAMILHEVT